MLDDPNLHFPKLPRIPETFTRIPNGGNCTIYVTSTDLVKVESTDVVAQIIGNLNGLNSVDELKRKALEFCLGSDSEYTPSEAEPRVGEIKERLESLLLGLHMNGLLEDAGDPNESAFSVTERQYYDDQLKFFSTVVDITRSADSRWGLQNKLKKSTVLVLTAGKLGWYYARQMCRVGVGTVRIISLSSSAFEDLHQINPHVHITITKPRRSELAVQMKASPADLCVVVLDGPLRSLMLEVNDLVPRLKLPVLYSWIELGKLFLGPWVVPKQTGCLRCYFGRRYSCASRPAEEEAYFKHLEESETWNPGQYFPLLLEWAGAFVALETMRIITFFAPPLTQRNQTFELDVLTGMTRPRRFLRLPTCSCESWTAMGQ